MWPSKFTGHTLSAGSPIEVAVPNSGGFGDPLQRDPELVLSDVLDGFTTAELAERDYGVVIDLERRAVDADAHAASARAGPRRRRSARYLRGLVPAIQMIMRVILPSAPTSKKLQLCMSLRLPSVSSPM